MLAMLAMRRSRSESWYAQARRIAELRDEITAIHGTVDRIYTLMDGEAHHRRRGRPGRH